MQGNTHSAVGLSLQLPPPTAPARAAPAAPKRMPLLATYNIQRTTYNVQHTTYNVQTGVAGLQHMLSCHCRKASLWRKGQSSPAPPQPDNLPLAAYLRV